MMFWALRYAADVDLNARKHVYTLGRFDTFEDADAAREATPVATLLEVVRRGD